MTSRSPERLGNNAVTEQQAKERRRTRNAGVTAVRLYFSVIHLKNHRKTGAALDPPFLLSATHLTLVSRICHQDRQQADGQRQGSSARLLSLDVTAIYTTLSLAGDDVTDSPCLHACSIDSHSLSVDHRFTHTVRQVADMMSETMTFAYFVAGGKERRCSSGNSGRASDTHFLSSHWLFCRHVFCRPSVVSK